MQSQEERRRQTEKRNDEQILSGSSPASGAGLQSIATELEGRLDAADEEISKLLSGDALQFLDNFVQQGGE